MKKWVKVLIIVLVAIIAVAGIIFTLVTAGVIGTGAKLYNDAEELANSQIGAMNAVMTDSFNEQFLSFCGTNIKGTVVKSLIAKVSASNLQNPDFPVTIDGVASVEDVDSNSTYTVKESYAKNGMINKITITEN